MSCEKRFSHNRSGLRVDDESSEWQCQGCSLLYLMGHQRNNARGGRGSGGCVGEGDDRLYLILTR